MLRILEDRGTPGSHDGGRPRPAGTGPGDDGWTDRVPSAAGGEEPRASVAGGEGPRASAAADPSPSLGDERNSPAGSGGSPASRSVPGDGAGPRPAGGLRRARYGKADPRRVHLVGLACVVTAAVVLPLTVASAGQVRDVGAALVPGALRHGDGEDPSAAPGRPPALLDLGLATAARCGPQLSSPEGVEGQTCVLIQGADTWARTYYRNATGRPLDAELTLMGPGGRTTRTRCDIGADDEPATCETPREHSRGGADGYMAVTEFAERGPAGALLLRSGSNSDDSEAS
ncbi:MULTISPECIES: hypothetical protein [unclassified Streptomyces]|uniref:hypothetical protein n=1 Tax=unclassified Streptomyces TaxID=2593676 RepID=UPI00331C9AC3